jgi:hypothetical protein
MHAAVATAADVCMAAATAVAGPAAVSDSLLPGT